MATEKRLIDVNALFPGKLLAVNIKNPMETVEDLMNRINNAPTVEAVEVVHGRWEKSKRHLWYKDDGEIDEYRYTSGFHNGPVCMVCGAHFCVHCEPNYDETECYDHHYICSMCGEPSLEGHENYCPNCGAKMDGDRNG